MKVLVVANDFPPKHGGIQTYHREIWRRFAPGEVAVLTTPHREARSFDAAQPFPVTRVRNPVLLPTPRLARRVRALAREHGTDIVVWDPELPVGFLAPRLGLPYAVVIHGGVRVRATLPIARGALARVLRGASAVISAGEFPAAIARGVVGAALPPVVIVPPGVDAERFRPLDGAARGAARRRFGLPEEGRLIVSLSRLVPRKGMDVLIDAAALLAEGRRDLVVAIGGGGASREVNRLERRAAVKGAPVVLLGRVPDRDLPSLYGCADVFAMLCRNAGLVREGFGMVFAEAAACGVPSVAGDSGGATDAVVDGVTGLVVHDPRDPVLAAAALARYLDDVDLRHAHGRAARERVEHDLGFDLLATRARQALLDAVARMAAA